MTSPSQRTMRTKRRRKQLLYGVTLLTLAAAAYSAIRCFDVAAIAEQELYLRGLIREHPWQSGIVGVALYSLASTTPGTSGKSFAVGWLFGFACGTLIINLGSTITASIVFLVTRRYLREPLAGRFAALLERFEARLQSEGPFLLFSLRLIPIVPFTVLNPLAALTSLRAKTFTWISLAGMLPGNALCAFVGASLPDLRRLHEQGFRVLIDPQLIVAFALLAAFPWVVRAGISAIRGRTHAPVG